jgi:hypothetical protein
MTAHCPQRLGTCPACATEIADRDVLIEYDGGDAAYAECPNCARVISPE